MSAADASRMNRSPPLLRYALLLAFLILTFLFAATTPHFGSLSNLLDVLRNASVAGIMFVGLTWVISSGEIDVSFMNIAALTGVVFAYLLQHRWDPAGAALASIGSGVAFGLLNGMLVGLLRFPSLIVTIATGGIAVSLAFIIGGGQPIYVQRNSFLTAFVNSSLFGVPSIGIVCILIFAVAWFVQERFVFGHHVYALAQNRKALEEMGVKTNAVIFGLFAFCALMASISGVMLAAILKSGQPTIGNSFFLDGLTVVLLGATAIRIGKPNIAGTAIALALLSILVNALALLGWPNSAAQILKGALLFLGVSMTLLQKRKPNPMGSY